MPNQAERLRQLEIAHLEDVNRMKDFTAQMIEPAIDQFDFPKIRTAAITTFMRGILDVPDAIHFRGNTFASYDRTFHHLMGDRLYRVGYQEFGDWLEQNWKGDMREWTAVRINERNIAHFMETWYGGKEERPAPDWAALQRSHDRILAGQNSKLYPLYVRLFDGMQTSAIELFLEDTSAGDDVLNQHLL